MSKYIDMTNEEIWKMLKERMERNGLKSDMNAVHIPPTTSNEKPLIKHLYYEEDAHNAIALAYRSGYERAMKGRPFKIGEKKKRWHWEPIDPNNLLKEGLRSGTVGVWGNVHKIILLKLGQEGFVDYLGKELGIFYYDCKVQSLYWINFYNIEKYLDMWVEDNE